ncbi:VENN motif pre-toxin domain-containing protein [Pandoraea sputorum]
MSGAGYGAIGASISAALMPDLIRALGNSGQPLDSAQRAALTTLAGLAGAVGAGAAGADANAGAFWAQNEATNNAEEHPGLPGIIGKIQYELSLVQKNSFGNKSDPDASPLGPLDNNGGNSGSSPQLISTPALFALALVTFDPWHPLPHVHIMGVWLRRDVAGR